jgi:hypothetical protein
MAWQLSGNFYENCSCDAICPCAWSNMAHRATQDYCRFALVFEIERGEIEGTNVSGTTFVMIGDAPPLMTDGNWRVGVVVDEGASEEQVQKLGQVISGELGGPPAAMGPLLGEFLGIERGPIAIERKNGTHHVKAGNFVDYSGERSTTDGEQVTLGPVAFHPAGPTLGVAPVSSSTVSAFGIEYSGQDLSGFANAFSWSG